MMSIKKDTDEIPLLSVELMNRWQRDFPIVEKPFLFIAHQHGVQPQEVMQHYQNCMAAGVLSRVGAVFHPSAGGASTLAAIEASEGQLEKLVQQVSSFEGVNHNYIREHSINIWFVITAANERALHRAIQELERITSHSVLTFPMVKAYRLNLAFDITKDLPHQIMNGGVDKTVPTVPKQDEELAALMEEGLPVVEQPFAEWAQKLGRTPDEVMKTLRTWLEVGLVRRFGNVLRHHELGFASNAMTVFQVPAFELDAAAQSLALCPEVTLIYQREPHLRWPYNLYCMVHGKDRLQVEKVIGQIRESTMMSAYPCQVLFSKQRLKQTGGSKFRLRVRSQIAVANDEVKHVNAF